MYHTVTSQRGDIEGLVNSEKKYRNYTAHSHIGSQHRFIPQRSFCDSFNEVPTLQRLGQMKECDNTAVVEG